MTGLRRALLPAVCGVLLAGGTVAFGHADTPTRVRPVAPLRSRPLQDSAADLLIKQRTVGKADAPITMYEVSDFQCPYCRNFFTETLPAVKQQYVTTGKLRLVFINFPIPELHHNAARAHEFAMCAAQQRRFWPVHDLLYRNQPRWAELADPQPVFAELADSAHLQRDSLRACLTSGAMRGLVQADAQAAWQAGVRSTPSFIIEGGLLTGAVPFTALQPILDSIYKAKRGSGG